jgi:hypothetical protein
MAEDIEEALLNSMTFLLTDLSVFPECSDCHDTVTAVVEKNGVCHKG